MRPRSGTWAARVSATVLLGVAALTPGASAPAGESTAATPDAVPGLEALRERVDRLRYEQASEARGARVVLAELVARFYETRRFEPAWQDRNRLDHLVAALEELVDDGLDPADYHVEALRSYRLDVRMGTTMTV